MSHVYRVIRAQTAGQFAAARLLIEEYAAYIGASMQVGLCFQNFAADALYRSLRFKEIAPYYFNPMAGVSYMALDLGTAKIAARRS